MNILCTIGIHDWENTSPASWSGSGWDDYVHNRVCMRCGKKDWSATKAIEKCEKRRIKFKEKVKIAQIRRKEAKRIWLGVE